MTRPTKYSKELLEKIITSATYGYTFTQLQDIYSIDRRRIAEIVKTSSPNTPVVSQSQVKSTSNSKIENQAKITNTSTTEHTVESILSKNGYNPVDWNVVNISKTTWDDTEDKVHFNTQIEIVRKNIEVKYPAPSTIKVTIPSIRKSNVKKNSSIKCAVILPDIQCGFRRNSNDGSLNPIHDRRALDVALQIANYLDPDRVILLGDNLDLAEMSTKYLTTPDFYFTTQASLVELSWWLSKIRSINDNTRIDYLAGNHENRANKYLNEKALTMYGLKNVNDLKGPPALSVEKLLSLSDLDIAYHQYPAGKVAINSNLVCIHGEIAKGGSGATVSELVKSARVSTIQGHIHRHEIATKTTWDAFDNYHMYTAASFGCLCRIDPGVVPGMLHRQNWQQGIGVVWYEEGGLEQFRMEFIPIIDGRAIYTNEIFEAGHEEAIADAIEKEMKFKVT